MNCRTSKYDWQAAIDVSATPAEATFLAPGEDPKLNKLYTSLSPAEQSKLLTEVDSYIKQTKDIKSGYSAMRDQNCLANEFLNVRLQQPQWTMQQVHLFIQMQCIRPDLVSAYAKVDCSTRIQHDPRLQAAVAKDPNLCSCFAGEFEKVYMGTLNSFKTFDGAYNRSNDGGYILGVGNGAMKKCGTM